MSENHIRNVIEAANAAPEGERHETDLGYLAQHIQGGVASILLL